MRRLLLLLSLSLLSPQIYAGGAIQTDINGIPYKWDTTIPLTFNPESGGLKSQGAYPHRESVDLIKDAFAEWISIPGIILRVIQGPNLPDGGDVTVTNFGQFLNSGTEDCYPSPGPNCFTPIIFDEDGSIINFLFGSCANTSILGFAGEDVDPSGNTTVHRGQALFSGACIDPPVDQPGCSPCKRILTDQEIRSIIYHEIGHLTGMDHSQVNPEVFEQCALAGGCPANLAESLPTMFPVLMEGAAMETRHRDDEFYFKELYGNPADTSFCSLSGKVFASDGVTEVRGVEVVARNINPLTQNTDAISFVSGAEAPRLVEFGKTQCNCREDCGAFSISHLQPGQTYQVCVQKISPQFTAGSSIEPLDPPFQGFSDACPVGLTFTCNCSGTSCPQFNNVQVLTDTDPDLITGPCDLGDQINTTDSSGGGCSLAKPRSFTWSFFQKLLVF